MDENKFQHRPISLIVDEVLEMETVRMIPATETSVLVNLKLNQKRARALAKKLLDKILVDEDKAVDLVTLSLRATLK